MVMRLPRIEVEQHAMHRTPATTACEARLLCGHRQLLPRQRLFERLQLRSQTIGQSGQRLSWGDGGPSFMHVEREQYTHSRVHRVTDVSSPRKSITTWCRRRERP